MLLVWTGHYYYDSVDDDDERLGQLYHVRFNAGFSFLSLDSVFSLFSALPLRTHEDS